MYSKHSAALESRMLGINRNNYVILPLVTNMASSVERRKDILWSREDTLLLISQQRERKKLFRAENPKKKECGSY